jgi:DNA transposition AAA+ family ATPase
MVNKLRGSDRLLIVDDAHKLTRPALQWFFDFHDATQVPVALVGTYELLDKLEDDTQRFSRVGYHEEIKHTDAGGKLVVDRALVKHLVKQLVPAANGESESLCDLAEQVAEQHGHYRSVHKQLKLAIEIKAGSKADITWVQAFRAAHTKLIRKYKLS